MKNCSIHGLANLARCAIEARVSPNTRDSMGKHTPVLVIAAERGHTRFVEVLLENGADPCVFDDDGYTALFRAAQFGRKDCVRLLIGAGADVRAENLCGNTPLHAAVMSKNLDCARLLVPVSDLGACSLSGATAFHSSVATASKECFELLLPLVDVDVKTPVGATALHIACGQGLFDFTKALIKAGASPMAKDGNLTTPLHMASQFGHLACVTHLLGRPDRPKMTPAEVDAVDDQGTTSLHLAAALGDERVCAALLEAGASLSARTAEGATPLMLARQLHPGRASLHQLLSGTGPPGTVCDRCGKTAEQADVPSLRRCGACQDARYCCEACAMADWRWHKRACRAFVAAREERTRAREV
jgi:ankyrin repeat protein